MEGDEIQRGSTVGWRWLGCGGLNEFWGLIGKLGLRLMELGLDDLVGVSIWEKLDSGLWLSSGI